MHPALIITFRSCALIFMFLGAFYGCHSSEIEVPKGILTPAKMSLILTDMHLADAVAGQTFPIKGGSDTVAWKVKSFSTLIFRKYGVDSTSFNRSFRYYIQNPQVMDQIYSTMVTQLTKMQAHMPSPASPVPAKVPLAPVNAPQGIKLNVMPNHLQPVKSSATN